MLGSNFSAPHSPAPRIDSKLVRSGMASPTAAAAAAAAEQKSIGYSIINIEPRIRSIDMNASQQASLSPSAGYSATLEGALKWTPNLPLESSMNSLPATQKLQAKNKNLSGVGGQVQKQYLRPLSLQFDPNSSTVNANSLRPQLKEENIQNHAQMKGVAVVGDRNMNKELFFLIDDSKVIKPENRNNDNKQIGSSLGGQRFNVEVIAGINSGEYNTQQQQPRSNSRNFKVSKIQNARRSFSQQDRQVVVGLGSNVSTTGSVVVAQTSSISCCSSSSHNTSRNIVRSEDSNKSMDACSFVVHDSSSNGHFVDVSVATNPHNSYYSPRSLDASLNSSTRIIVKTLKANNQGQKKRRIVVAAAAASAEEEVKLEGETNIGDDNYDDNEEAREGENEGEEGNGFSGSDMYYFDSILTPNYSVNMNRFLNKRSSLFQGSSVPVHSANQSKKHSVSFSSQLSEGVATATASTADVVSQSSMVNQTKQRVVLSPSPLGFHVLRRLKSQQSNSNSVQGSPVDTSLKTIQQVLIQETVRETTGTAIIPSETQSSGRKVVTQEKQDSYWKEVTAKWNSRKNTANNRDGGSDQLQPLVNLKIQQQIQEWKGYSVFGLEGKVWNEFGSTEKDDEEKKITVTQKVHANMNQIHFVQSKQLTLTNQRNVAQYNPQSQLLAKSSLERRPGTNTKGSQTIFNPFYLNSSQQMFAMHAKRRETPADKVAKLAAGIVANPLKISENERNRKRQSSSSTGGNGSSLRAASRKENVSIQELLSLPQGSLKADDAAAVSVGAVSSLQKDSAGIFSVSQRRKKTDQSYDNHHLSAWNNFNDDSKGEEYDDITISDLIQRNSFASQSPIRLRASIDKIKKKKKI